MAKFLDEEGLRYFWLKCIQTFVTRKEILNIKTDSSCPHCGAPLGDGNYCEYCGSYLGVIKFINELDTK